MEIVLKQQLQKQNQSAPGQDKSALADAMREIEGSFEEDFNFGNSDNEMEQEAARFDQKGKKRKTPVVIDLDSGRRPAKKTLKVPKPKTATKKTSAKKAEKGSSEVDFTINLSPELKRSRTIMPGEASHKKLLEMQGTAPMSKATRGQKSKDDQFKKKPVLAGKRRKTADHACAEKKYTATSKWNDIITDRELERIETNFHLDSFIRKSHFDFQLEDY